MTCPKCKGEMEEGTILDRGDLNTEFPARWGKYRKFRLDHDMEEKDILSYRCTECGYLENYAKGGAKE